MKPFDRDLLVLMKTEFMTEQSIEQEVEKLHYIFLNLESPSLFSVCHELVDRNRITNNQEKLETIFYSKSLKPFRFIICKN